MTDGITEIAKVIKTIDESSFYLDELEDETGIVGVAKVAVDNGLDTEQVIKDILNIVLLFSKNDKSMNKKIKKLKSAWKRWNSGGEISKSELAMIVGYSTQTITVFQGTNPKLKAHRLGDKGKVMFNKADWLEYKQYLVQ